MTSTRLKLRVLLAGVLTAPLTVALFVVAVGSVEKVSAVPSFARKYRVSCSTCHNVFPQLNAFGRFFRAKGYRMPGRDDRFVRDPQVPLGDSMEDRLWPRAVSSSDLPGSSVAGFIVNSHLNAFPDRGEGAEVEFDGIEEIGLLVGGTVGRKWSFFG
ncbi:MAG: hypothetical protein V3U86_00170, partial [Acidobacteriota bacterium]